MFNPDDKEFRNKIRVIMSIAESFIYNKARTGMSDIALINAIREAYSARDISKETWFIELFNSFYKAVTTKTPVNIWMSNQLSEYSIVSATAAFEHDIFSEFNTIFDINSEWNLCMGFTYSFLNNQTLPKELKQIKKAHDQIGRFIKTTPKRQLDEIMPGDIITYQDDKGRSQHIGLFVGYINGKQYAISKFGIHGTYLHPLDGTPENYGTPVAYVNEKLDRAIIAKLEFLQEHLSPTSHVASNPSDVLLEPEKNTPSPSDSDSFLDSGFFKKSPTPMPDNDAIKQHSESPAF